LTESVRDVGVVVVAAGSGRRFADDSGLRKQYRELAGIPLVVWAVRPFVEHPRVCECVLVLPAEDVAGPPSFLGNLPLTLVAGGAERHDSVRQGIEAFMSRPRMILVHDGARPLVGRALIDRVIEAAESGTAAIPGIRVIDTLKEVGPDGMVISTPDRDRLWQVQTPQGFPADLLATVHRRAHVEGIGGTDDAALFERYSLPVRVVDGDANNLKVTRQSDLPLAEMIVQRQRHVQ
jgi:2-C-methyl-D-erythritol 4-phosphate cytidylyltransferase